jgi:hypothetical protein
MFIEEEQTTIRLSIPHFEKQGNVLRFYLTIRLSSKIAKSDY